MKLIPLAATERILREAGAERVADSAKLTLNKMIEKTAIEITEEARRFARHAGRKTIRGEDIKLAVKNEKIKMNFL